MPAFQLHRAEGDFTASEEEEGALPSPSLEDSHVRMHKCNVLPAL